MFLQQTVLSSGRRYMLILAAYTQTLSRQQIKHKAGFCPSDNGQVNGAIRRCNSSTTYQQQQGDALDGSVAVTEVPKLYLPSPVTITGAVSRKWVRNNGVVSSLRGSRVIVHLLDER